MTTRARVRSRARGRGLPAGAIALFLAFPFGCASTQDKRFPSREELQAIRAREAPVRIADADRVDVAEWTLAGPLPDVVGVAPRSPQGPLDEALRAAAATNPDVTASEGMHCVARELARFYVAHDKGVGRGLGDFIVARCGEPALQLDWRSIYGEVPDEVSDDELLAEWRDGIGQLASSLVTQGPGSVGMAFARANGKAIVLGATGRRRVQVEPISMLPAGDGTIRVRGVFLERVDRARAHVTQGRYGAVECEAAEGVSPPRFDFVCPTAAEDELAWIEIGGFREGRLLGKRMLDLIVRPARTAGDRYVRPRYGPEVDPSGEEDLAQALAGLLNRVRLEAGLKPLELAPEQTRSATELAPHFFSSLVEQDEATSDTIVLGMMAGWDVDGVVVQGGVGWSVVHPADDLSELLSAALERPGPRHVLLGPDMNRLAIGPVSDPESSTLAVLFGTYSLFDTSEPQRRADAAWQKVVEARAKKGRSAPARLTAVQNIAFEAAQLIEEGAEPKDALEHLLHRASRKLRGKRISAGYFNASSLDELEIPKDLVDKDPLSVALAVAPYREKGAAWGSYVVLYVTIRSAGTRTATGPVTSHDG